MFTYHRFASVFFPLVAWITFIALWVRAASYGIWLIFSIPEAMGAYLFGGAPLVTAVYIWWKHWHPDREFHSYYAGVAGSAVLIAAALFFGLPSQYFREVHATFLVVGGVGLCAASMQILWEFSDVPPQLEDIVIYGVCFGSAVVPYALFRYNLQAAWVVGLFCLVSAVMTVFVDQRLWPSGKRWLRAHWPARKPVKTKLV